MTTTVNDVSQLGHLAYQTDGAGTVLATFSYDDQGVPTSVVLGSDPVNGPRYSYVYNGHGDVVALTDATGTVVASYSYDVFGMLTASSEQFPNNTSGWTNPYRYDGRDGVRYDTEAGLYWLSVRAYDPALAVVAQPVAGETICTDLNDNAASGAVVGLAVGCAGGVTLGASAKQADF